MQLPPAKSYAIAFLALAAASSTASALPPAPALRGIRVVQGGVDLGTIQPYHGTLTGAANYNYIQPSGAPINGPAPEAREGRLFFYKGADGLHFNVIFNAEGSGNGSVSWALAVTGSTVDPVVQFSDDPVPPATVPDLLETPSNNSFVGDWQYQARVDGGVIGPLGGTAWTISIDQLGYASPNDRGLNSLRVFGDGSRSIALNMNPGPSGDLQLIAVAAPEPGGATLAAVLAACLARRHNTARVARVRRI